MKTAIPQKDLENPGLKAIDDILSLTIPQMIERSAKFYGDLTAMRYFRKGRFNSITFNKFLSEVNRVARGLVLQGIKPGDKVGILSRNRPEWGITYVAVLKVGGINVPLDALLKPTEMRHIIRESGVKSVVTSDEFISDFISGDISTKKLEFIIGMDNAKNDGDSMLPIISFSGLGKGDKTDMVLNYKGDPDDIAAILFTSGTTGQSKGVVLTHHNILSDINDLLKMIYFYTWDNFLSVLPIHHTFECTCGFLTPLAGGASITYARSLKSRDILEDIVNNKCTLLLGVPLLFEKMYASIMRAIEKKPRTTRIIFGTSMEAVKLLKKSIGYNVGGRVFKGLREKAGLSSLRLLVSGGAPLAPEIGEGFELLGIKLIQGYGLTETSPVLTINPLDKPNHSSIGIPLPSARLKILNPNEEGIGEIAAKGPMVMKGYYNNPEATKQVFTEDGWLKTGDSGYVDEKGYYFIVGRVKNLIVTRAGKNIYPEEIEGILLKSPYIAEVLVMGRTGSNSDKMLVDSVEAIVVPDYEYLERQAEIRGNEFTEQELNSIIKSEINELCADIADYKRVKSFRIREDEFIKTSTKKIKRYLVIKPSVRINNHNKKNDRNG